MKLATIIMSLVLTGVFAHAQGAATEQTAPAQEGVKAEAPMKKEKKEKKHKKHGKKEKSEKSEEEMKK